LRQGLCPRPHWGTYSTAPEKRANGRLDDKSGRKGRKEEGRIMERREGWRGRRM